MFGRQTKTWDELTAYVAEGSMPSEFAEQLADMRIGESRKRDLGAQVAGGAMTSGTALSLASAEEKQRKVRRDSIGFAAQLKWFLPASIALLCGLLLISLFWSRFKSVEPFNGETKIHKVGKIHSRDLDDLAGRLKGTIASLKEREVHTSQALAKQHAARQQSLERRTLGEVALQDLIHKYREAEPFGEWPLDWRGQMHERDAVRNLIVQLDTEVAADTDRVMQIEQSIEQFDGLLFATRKLQSEAAQRLNDLRNAIKSIQPRQPVEHFEALLTEAENTLQLSAHGEWAPVTPVPTVEQRAAHAVAFDEIMDRFEAEEIHP